MTYSGSVVMSCRLHEPTNRIYLHATPSLTLQSGARAIQDKQSIPLQLAVAKDLSAADQDLHDLHGIPLTDVIQCTVDSSAPLQASKLDIQIGFRGPIDCSGSHRGLFAPHPPSVNPQSTSAVGKGKREIKPKAGSGQSSSPSGVPAGLMLATHFEPSYAHSVFPCVDFYDTKATFALELSHIPKAYIAVSNMPIVKDAEMSGAGNSGYRTVCFAPTPVMSAYLLAFAVGPFACTQGQFVREMASHATPTSTKAKPAAASAAATAAKGPGVAINIYIRDTSADTYPTDLVLKSVIAGLHWAEEYFQTPYSLPKLDVVIVPALCLGGVSNRKLSLRSFKGLVM